MKWLCGLALFVLASRLMYANTKGVLWVREVSSIPLRFSSHALGNIHVEIGLPPCLHRFIASLLFHFSSTVPLILSPVIARAAWSQKSQFDFVKYMYHCTLCLLIKTPSWLYEIAAFFYSFFIFILFWSKWSTSNCFWSIYLYQFNLAFNFWSIQDCLYLVCIFLVSSTSR